MIAEMFFSLLLLFFVILLFGCLYLWLLWLLADITNP